MGLGAAVLTILILRSFARNDSETSSPPGQPADKTRFESAAPSIASFGANDMPMEVQNYLREKLDDWAERLGTEPDRSNTGLTMEAACVARAIRYDGPLVSGEIDKAGDPLERLDLAGVYVDVIRRQSTFRAWPIDGESAKPANPSFALATLAWCVRSDNLKNEASQIRTIPDARRWFERFLEHVIPTSVPSDLPTTGLEASFPELIEYRLHLSRISRLKSAGG